MTLYLPLPRKKVTTLISAYAPTTTNLDVVKDRFYKDMKETNLAVLRAGKFIILGDINVHVGRDYMFRESVMEKHGKCNSNGLLLLESCAAHGLLITNTEFRVSNCNKRCTHAPNNDTT